MLPDLLFLTFAAVPPVKPVPPPPPITVGLTPNVTVLRHTGDTLRDETLIVGLAGTITAPRWGVADIAVDRLHATFHPYEIPFFTLDIPPVDQTRGTLVLGRFVSPWWLRAGTHLIRDDSDGLAAGVTGIVGVRRWWTRFSGGLDLYASRFAATDPVQVGQATAHVGALAWQGATWRVDATVGGTAQHLDTDLVGEGQTWFSSGGELAVTGNRWRIAAGGWAGDRVHAVEDAGFTVHDEADHYTWGVGASVGWTFTRALGATLSAGREAYRVSPTSGGSTVDHVTLLVGLTF